MRLSPPLFLLLAGFVSGCAEEPFVDHGISVTVQKEKQPIQRGIRVCYNSHTPWSEVIALAEEQCATHGLKPSLQENQRWQCRTTAPHLAGFICVDPEMRNPNGSYVNPLIPRDVADWEKRTGKKAPTYGAVRGATSSPATPDSQPAAALGSAPPPAPVAVSPPPPLLTPNDIAGKPSMPNRPLLMDTQPPPPPLPTEGSFKLPVGSWGDAFQD
ncbi:MAG: hypothetical protein K2X44_11790 [Magnetospirillum sp.]|nr:hypothetical protein [Magnetospirillum sp.]